MRRTVWALTTAAIVLGFSTAQSASGAGCTQAFNAEGTASTCGHLSWTYDPQHRRFDFRTQVTASDDPDGTLYVYKLVAACSNNVLASGQGDLICGGAAACPPKPGPDGLIQGATYQGMRARRGGHGQPPGPMTTYGQPICVYHGKSVPMAAVVAAVREQLVRQVGRPRIRVQPATQGLVHWPMLFSAPAQHQTRLSISKPLAGAITADPDYIWDLGDGQTAHGAGHPYAPGVDPRSPAGAGYYVAGSYRQTGAHPVRLVLTWEARITLGPAGSGLVVDLDPIVFRATATAHTVSATNHLYGQVPD